MDNSIQSNVTSNLATPLGQGQMTLEAYIMVNGHQAKALFDTGTMGDNLISGKFISTHRIATETLENPISLKMAVKGSRSTINFKAKPVVQIGPPPGEITEALVSSLENYDIFLGMPYLNKHKAIIDCGNATIRFPNIGYNLQCKKGNSARFSAATSTTDTPTLPDFKSEYPAVFPPEKPTKLPPLRAINHRIQLTDTKTDSNPKIFSVPDRLMPKFRDAIDKWKDAGIIYPSEAHNPVNMFPKLKPNGEVRLLADLVARNKITIKDHGPIPNQALILRTLARAKYRSSIDLSNWYFQIRINPEDEKYNTIKTPFGSFACKVMLQGDTNAPATAMRVIEHVLEGCIGKFVWAYLDDINIYSDTLDEHI